MLNVDEDFGPKSKASFLTACKRIITKAARRHAELAVRARAAGKGFPTPDGYLAAIAAAHDFAVASRDPSASTSAGLTLIDPWAAVV